MFFSRFLCNASVLNTIDEHHWIMCVVVAELSEALASRPRGASDPSSNPIRNILVLFLTISDYNYVYSSGFPTNNDDLILLSRKRKYMFFR